MADPAPDVPNPVTAPPEMLIPAIAELLRRIPETWQTYTYNDLTETQSQSLLLLIASGLVERRGRHRLQMLNHPMGVKYTFTATGTYNLETTFEKVCAAMWTEWQDAYAAWKESDRRDTVPFLCERLEPSEWRLTSDGVESRDRLASNDQQKIECVFDWVLRRGIFDGQLRWFDGQLKRYGPVPGRAELVSMERVKIDATVTGTVNVGNWGEGADIFAAAFAKAVAQLIPGQEEKKPRWTQDSVNEEIRKLKKTHQLAYEKWQERLKAGDTAATEEARSVFGRNVVAEKLGCSEGLVSTSTAWQEISKALGLSVRTPGSRPAKVGSNIAEEQSAQTSSGKDDPAYLAEKNEALIRIRKRQQELVQYVQVRSKAAEASGMTLEIVRQAADAIIISLESDSTPPDMAEKQMAEFGVQVEDACRRKYGQAP